MPELGVGLQTDQEPAVYESIARRLDEAGVDVLSVYNDLRYQPAIGPLLHNRLQEAAEQVRPEVADWHAFLAGLRPAGSLLSGSGSCLFALCHDHRDALRVARGLRTAPGAGQLLAPGRVELGTIVRSCS